MIEGFEIVDGRLFVDKELFRLAQLTDNNLSKLTGSCCANMFKQRPKVLNGPESVIIDYEYADHVAIPKELYQFVTEIQENYHHQVRGVIKVLIDEEVLDVVINHY